MHPERQNAFARWLKFAAWKRKACRLALSFPTPALNVFAGGTFLAVLVPLLTQLDVGGREAEAAALPNRVRRVLGWLLFVVCGLWVFYFSFPISRW